MATMTYHDCECVYLEDVLLKHLILRSVAQTILKRTLTFIGTKSVVHIIHSNQQM